METTHQALADGFEANIDHYGFKFGDGYELTFEPLSYGRMYVALYQHQQLLTNKVVVKPGYIKD